MATPGLCGSVLTPEVQARTRPPTRSTRTGHSARTLRHVIPRFGVVEHDADTDPVCEPRRDQEDEVEPVVSEREK